jgi:hypothetical protein
MMPNPVAKRPPTSVAMIRRGANNRAAPLCIFVGAGFRKTSGVLRGRLPGVTGVTALLGGSHTVYTWSKSRKGSKSPLPEPYLRRGGSP